MGITIFSCPVQNIPIFVHGKNSRLIPDLLKVFSYMEIWSEFCRDAVVADRTGVLVETEEKEKRFQKKHTHTHILTYINGTKRRERTPEDQRGFFGYQSAGLHEGVAPLARIIRRVSVWIRPICA